MNAALFDRLLAPIRARIFLMVGRFVLRAVNEGPLLRTVQMTGLDGETLDGVEFFNQYGFACRPKPGAELVGVFVGGTRDHGLVIASADRRYRISLAEGEVAIHDDQGQKVHLKRDSLEIVTPKDVNVDSEGSVTIDGADGVDVKSASGSIKVTATSADVTITGGTLVDLVAASVQARVTAAVSFLIKQSLATKYDSHQHIGSFAGPKNEYKSAPADFTTVFKAE